MAAEVARVFQLAPAAAVGGCAALTGASLPDDGSPGGPLDPCPCFVPRLRANETTWRPLQWAAPGAFLRK